MKTLMKSRHGLLLFDNQAAYIVSFKVTSHDARKKFNGEYIIMKWKEAGLTKPSVVRLSKMLKMQERDFLKKIGDLEDTDIYGIATLVRFYYNL